MLKNILSLLSGTIGAQLVALLAAPIITRIYLPEEFGMMTTVWAVIGIAGVVACLAYERTIVLERNDADARRLVMLCVYMALISAAIMSFFVYLFDTFLYQEYFGVEHIYLLVFSGVLVFGVRKALDFFATREKRFHLIAVSIFLGSVFGAAWKISVGVEWGATAEALLVGNIIGTTMPAVVLWFYVRKDLRVKGEVGGNSRLNLLRKYSEFPQKQVPNAVLNALQQQAPIFILAAYFSPEIVGFYGLAMAVLLRPVRALAEAVSRVYLQRVSRLGHEDAHGDLLKATTRLGMFAAPLCVILFFYGESLFKLLFGEGWSDAGRMASLMAPWVFMLVINVPTTQALIVRRELQFILVFNAIYLIARVSGLFVAIYATRDVYAAILVFSLIGFIANVIYIRKGLVVTKYA